MLLLPWAGLEGRHATPNTSTPGPSRGLVGRAGRMRAGASEGCQDWGSDAVGSELSPPLESPFPHRAGLSPSHGPPAALSPTRANHGPQPGASPAPWNRGPRNCLCHPPLGGESSLVPTVEQKAAPPWTGPPPPPTSPCPSPFHFCLASRATCLWQPPPPTEPSWPAAPHPTPTPQHLAQGPCPSGAARETLPQLFPGADTGRAQH